MIFASIFHVPKAMPTGTDIYFVRILSCLNCSSFWSRKMNWFLIVFFSFCFTFIFRVSHITVSSWRFDLNVWFQSLPNVFPVFVFRTENFEFCRVSHFCVILFFFPVSRWFSFWKISDNHWFSLLSRRFRQAKFDKSRSVSSRRA